MYLILIAETKAPEFSLTEPFAEQQVAPEGCRRSAASTATLARLAVGRKVIIAHPCVLNIFSTANH
jgi:hypothetical protein